MFFQLVIIVSEGDLLQLFEFFSADSLLRTAAEEAVREAGERPQRCYGLPPAHEEGLGRRTNKRTDGTFGVFSSTDLSVVVLLKELVHFQKNPASRRAAWLRKGGGTPPANNEGLGMADRPRGRRGRAQRS